MGLSRSLSIGTSALDAQYSNFDVISNNIANVDTTGYKASTVNFSDMLSQIYSYGTSSDGTTTNGSGGTNPIQYGLGVGIGSIETNTTQGTVETTTNPLDMALSGDGYFVYSLNGSQVYSRSGNITKNSDGNLVDSSSGAYLQGYNAETDSNGNIVVDSSGNTTLSGTLESLKISSDTTSPPKQTQSVTLTGNLDSSADSGATKSASITIYDQQGNARTLALDFTKSTTANQYTVSGTIDGKSVTLGTTNVTFNTDGTLSTPLSLTINASDLNTALGNTSFDATTPKNITVTLATAGSLADGLTNYAGSNDITASKQDGYKKGALNSLSVDSEGKISGSFSNGQTEVLGQVVVAKFSNPEGLVKTGSNFLVGSSNSGDAVLGTAGETFSSTSIKGESLEQSNVDLATEFTNMITAQRAFEAASKVITTVDQMLSDITSLKR